MNKELAEMNKWNADVSSISQTSGSSPEIQLNILKYYTCCDLNIMQ